MLGKMLSSVRALLLTLIIGVIVCAAFRNNKGFVRGPMIANSRSQSQSTALNMATYKVTLRQEGKELAVLDVPDDKVLLDVALDAGIDLPHDCKLGVCLTCPAKIVSGTGVQDVDPSSTLEDSVQEQGFALTCCLYARSDMEIDIIDEDALIDAQFVKGDKTTY